MSGGQTLFPLLEFEGRIIEITQHAQVGPALDLLRKDAHYGEAADDEPYAYVGFDMEWRPEFTPGQVNPVALIQLASERVCLLFYMLRLRSMPKALKELLLDPYVLKVGLSVRNDLKKLQSQYYLVPRGLLDVSEMARELGYERLGLQSLAQELLARRLAKGKTRSNWASRQLTPEQLSYAATDPYATLLIYNELEAVEQEEGYEPYWTYVLDWEEKAAAQAVTATKAAAPKAAVAVPVIADPRVDELAQSVQSLSLANSNLTARLAAVEADSQRARAALEQRLAALETENRRLLAELARMSAQQQPKQPQQQPKQQQQPMPQQQPKQQQQQQQPPRQQPKQKQEQEYAISVREEFPEEYYERKQQQQPKQQSRQQPKQQPRQQEPKYEYAISAREEFPEEYHERKRQEQQAKQQQAKQQQPRQEYAISARLVGDIDDILALSPPSQQQPLHQAQPLPQRKPDARRRGGGGRARTPNKNPNVVRL